MTRKAAILFLMCGSLGISAHFVPAQKPKRPRTAVAAKPASKFSSITQREIELLLEDVARSNPKVLDTLRDDRAKRQAQIRNLKELLAFASQAEKDGLAGDPTNKQELENIRAEVIATSFDRETNKGKAAMPPFGYIPDARVTAYLALPAHDADFDRFLNAKVAVLRASDPNMADRVITPEERAQARDIFAKTQIYEADYEAAVKANRLSKDFIERTNLNVKLQQAQFLARAYSAKTSAKAMATDQEIAAYLRAHPALDPAAKRAAAEKLLERARKGEDFAALANEFTQDPGNTGNDGTPQGGLYKDVPLGMMVKPFEKGALALAPGQVSPTLVESDFGYHIIKLERKGETNYDVRHILIATTVPDPSNPGARPAPLKEYVRAKIETEKEKKMIAGLVAANNISVPADFVVPPASPAAQTTMPKRRIKRSR